MQSCLETVYARLHVDKFSMLKYFRGQVDPRKYFNTKIYHTKILLHENFPIYGSQHLKKEKII